MNMTMLRWWPFVTFPTLRHVQSWYKNVRNLSSKIDKPISRIAFRRILMSFRKRLNSSTMPSSRVLDNANSFMTKNGVAVTVIFILTMGYSIIYYVLGNVGVASYVVNTPAQKIEVLLSTLNSVANPFVYILLMPAFRSSLRKTFNVPRLRCEIHCNMNASTEHCSMTGSTSGTEGTELEHASSRVTLEETTVCSNDDVHLEMTHVAQST